MAETSRIAYVFPGQGSQNVGMGQDLYETFPSAREVFDQADSALGFPISRLCFDGPEPELRRTDNVQPAILVTSIACLRAAQQASNSNLPPPDYVAGHSLGEYTALVAASVLSLSDAVLLVRKRGELMYRAGEEIPGSMLAIIGLDRAATEEVCLQSGTEISNLNCPGQIVISGAVDALAEASNLAKTRGARRAIPLKVSGAFHSSLMEPVIGEFSRAISSFEFHPAAIPVVANTTAQVMTDIAAIKAELVHQLRCCIQWQPSVEYMVSLGVTSFYEIGPGRVLSSLIRRINAEAQTSNISGSEDIAPLESSANSS
ncbi:MAG: ACP S-malonyltransferase [Chloroflexota bacterium]|nr:ACP S-malonyltransferase [Chloroflexota bacterium]